MKQFIVMCTISLGFFLAAAGCNSFERHSNPGLDGQPCPLMPAFQNPALLPAPVPKGAQWLPGSQPLPPPPPPPFDSLSKSFNTYEVPGKSNTSASLAPLVRLYPPEVVESQSIEKKTSDYLPDPLVTNKPEPPKVEEAIKPMAPAAALPVGISQFVQVNDKVANGLRPSLDDGLDWLGSTGYKTVLYIHEAGTSESADRKQVEKRGMRFLTLEVSPSTLTQKKIDEFNLIVTANDGMPLFVYDRDGSLTGAMWYLHFRQTPQTSDETARNQARSLGFTEDREGSHQQMWQAIQKLLQDSQNK